MSSRVGLCSDAACGEAAEQGEDGSGDSASLPASSSDDGNCVINSKKSERLNQNSIGLNLFSL